ncbi:MAG: hypothetical protein ACJAZO_003761 [Myxococcota bacterium]|jgi:hypothetical protein
MTIRGRLERIDIGMGAWVVVTAEGARLQLDGEVSESLAGSQVVAVGDKRASHGFAMLPVDGTLVLTAPLAKAED